MQIIFIKNLSEKATEKLRDKKQIKNIWEFTNLRKSDYRDFSLIGILFFFFKLNQEPRFEISQKLGVDPKIIVFWFCNKRARENQLNQTVLDSQKHINFSLKSPFICGRAGRIK